MVNAVAQFQATVSACVGAYRDKQYWENVSKAGSALEKLNAGDLDKIFETIASNQPLEVGSLVFVLGGKLKRLPNDNAAFNRFVTQFDFVASNVSSEEMQFINDKFVSVMSAFSIYLVQNHYAIHGICVIQHAIHSLSYGISGVLTNLHSRLFLLCLEAKRFDPALPFLNLDAGNCFLNAQKLQRVGCEQGLLFFYYGGLIKLAFKDFAGAAQMFESCVCFPAFSPSAIMLESLKKLILLNMILGRPQTLPNYRSPCIQRLWQSKCQKYHTLVQAYNEVVENKSNRNVGISRLFNQIQNFMVDLEKDNNVGLANELFLSTVRSNIRKLPEVFSKLQIEKVGKYCRIDGDQYVPIQNELENFLQRDDIIGKIDVREGTVSFQPVQRSEEVDQQKLDEATKDCSQLDDLLRRSKQFLDLC